MPQSPTFVTTAAGLNRAISAALAADCVALDTEFVWEQTYYPRLGLIQMGLPGERIYLIDCVALSDLSPLARILEEPDLPILLHDAQQDLQILHRATGGVPQQVFDTQLAGGFTVGDARRSLQQMIAEALGITLDKGATRTNWLQRPLSDEQITYAANDVRHLPTIYEKQKQALVETARFAWFKEELAFLESPESYADQEAQTLFLRVKGAGRLRREQLAVLQHLAIWREESARLEDRPRGRVASDAVLVALAQRRPEQPKQLRRIHGIPQHLLRNPRQQRLLETIEQARRMPREEQPSMPKRLVEDDERNLQVDFLLACVRGLCQRADIDATLYTTRAMMRDLIYEIAPADNRLLQGWRQTFLGETLADLRAGKAAVRLAPGTPSIPELA